MWHGYAVRMFFARLAWPSRRAAVLASGVGARHLCRRTKSPPGPVDVVRTSVLAGRGQPRAGQA